MPTCEGVVQLALAQQLAAGASSARCAKGLLNISIAISITITISLLPVSSSSAGGPRLAPAVCCRLLMRCLLPGMCCGAPPADAAC
jgi:hypothetical protein